MIKIVTGACLDWLRRLKSDSIDCCVTSPPYFGLRDYGVSNQIGLEPSPSEYVAKLVEVFREVRRALKPTGTLWLNLGDSYAGSGRGGNPEAGTKQGTNKGSQSVGVLYGREQESAQQERTRIKQQFEALKVGGLKPKDLIGIPWRVAFALQQDGWYLRQDIIWHKPNPMPESVRDRCTKAHEYLFLLSKSEKYYFDAEAISEPVAASTVARLAQPTLDQQRGSNRVPGKTNGPMKAKPPRFGGQKYGDNADEKHRTKSGNDYAISENGKRNRRSVWTVTTKPFKEAHFATFPPDLIRPCILAGCPEHCCSKCGAPYEAKVERVDQGWDGSRYGERAVDATGGAISGGTNKSTLGSSNGKQVGQRRVVGYEPSCSCGAVKTNGIVLDPFGGAGTTALVAREENRHAVLIELNSAYVDIANRRLFPEQFAKAAE